MSNFKDEAKMSVINTGSGYIQDNTVQQYFQTTLDSLANQSIKNRMLTSMGKGFFKGLPIAGEMLVAAYEEAKDIQRLRNRVGNYNLLEMYANIADMLRKQKIWVELTDENIEKEAKSFNISTREAKEKLRNRNKEMIKSYASLYYEEVGDGSFWDKTFDVVIADNLLTSRINKKNDFQLAAVDWDQELEKLTRSTVDSLRRELLDHEKAWIKERINTLRDRGEAAKMHIGENNTKIVNELLEALGIASHVEKWLTEMGTGDYEVGFSKLKEALKQLAPSVSKNLPKINDTLIDNSEAVKEVKRESTQEIKEVREKRWDELINSSDARGEELKRRVAKRYDYGKMGKMYLFSTDIERIIKKSNKFGIADEAFGREWSEDSYKKVVTDIRNLEAEYQKNIITDSEGNPVFYLKDRNTTNILDLYMKDYSVEDLYVYSKREKAYFDSEINFEDEEQEEAFKKAAKEGKAVKFLLDHDLQPSLEAEDNDLKYFRDNPIDYSGLFEAYKDKIPAGEQEYYQQLFARYQYREVVPKTGLDLTFGPVAKASGYSESLEKGTSVLFLMKKGSAISTEAIRNDKIKRKKEQEAKKKPNELTYNDHDLSGVDPEYISQYLASGQNPEQDNGSVMAMADIPQLSDVASDGVVNGAVGCVEVLAEFKCPCVTPPFPEGVTLPRFRTPEIPATSTGRSYDYKRDINRCLEEIYYKLKERLPAEIF